MGTKRTSLHLICLGVLTTILGCSSADVPESLWKNPEEISNYTPGVRSLVFSPTGKHLASMHMAIHPWNMRVSTVFSTPQLHIWTIPEDYLWPRSQMSRELDFFTLVFDDGGEHLLTDAEGGVWRYDLAENTSDFASLESERVSALSPDGRLAVFSDDRDDNLDLSESAAIEDDPDHSVRVMNLETREEISRLTLPYFGMRPIFSPDSRYLLSPGENRPTQLFEVVTGQVVLEFSAEGFRYPISLSTSNAAGSSTSEQQLLMAAYEESSQAVGVWSLETGKLLYKFAAGWEEVWHVALSPDGRFLAVSGESDLENKARHGLVRFWNLETGAELAPIKDDSTWGITAVAFSPDGNRLATGDGGGIIKLWPLSEEMRSKVADE